MDEPTIPPSANALQERFTDLRVARTKRHERQRNLRSKRKPLTKKEREEVLMKTAARCHVCGGAISGKKWQADHVLAHSSGGKHSVDNYLPAHVLCNNYRWDYDSEEVQWILKIGVWARTQMERSTTFGPHLREQFLKYELRRQRRRKQNRQR